MMARYYYRVFICTWAILLVSCRYENELEKYAEKADTTNPSLGLTAHFPIQNGIADISGNEIQGFVHGGPEFTAGADESPGGAVVLNGRDNYITIYTGYHDSLTVSLWFASAASLESQGSRYPYLIDYGIDRVSMYLDAVSSATYAYFKVDTLQNNWDAALYLHSTFEGWHHLCIQAGYKGKKPRLYYDFGSGNPELSRLIELESPAGFNPLAEILYIGRSSGNDFQRLTFFKGMIDEIRIYGRSLSDQEIRALYNMK